MYKGPAKIDRKTKNLVKRLNPVDIAIIMHEDIDEVSALSLVETKIKVVINASSSISGKYPNRGPEILEGAGVVIFDEIGEEFFEGVNNNDLVEIKGQDIFINGNYTITGKILSREVIQYKMKIARENIEVELGKFIENTLNYAQKEKVLVTGGIKIPKIRTGFKDRQALVVVRGQGYKNDLRMLNRYIKEIRPILIGVDGGADALMEFGFKPDMIIGDMDSVSDESLRCAKEIVVHAYIDGRAPGFERIRMLKLEERSVTFSAPGTSEDIAMLLSYEYGADLIVAVGSHSNMIDFLEKGRKGMASTFLVRLKIGTKLVDARGVSKLYNEKLQLKYIFAVILASLVPITVLLSFSKPARVLLALVRFKIKILLGL